MPAYRTVRSFFAALGAMAEKLRQEILRESDPERVKLVTRTLNESDMVFVIWPDTGGQEGFGIQIIKGEELMPPLEGFETTEEMRVAAIPCVGLAQALAARDAWGGYSETNGYRCDFTNGKRAG